MTADADRIAAYFETSRGENLTEFGGTVLGCDSIPLIELMHGVVVRGSVFCLGLFRSFGVAIGFRVPSLLVGRMGLFIHVGYFFGNDLDFGGGISIS